ncbi:MAG TPA: hypothetical protein VFT04_04205 [Gemmatimonadales bacterium]|nr:hypothetical protein [Gemmatimonadales bacterium]
MRHSFLLVVISAAAIGCDADAGSSGGGSERRGDTAPDTQTVQQAGETRPDSIRASVGPASCDLIPRAEIERIAGPLDGEPTPEDRGCWYHVVVDTTTAEWKQLREGAERARASGMDERAIAMYHPTRAGIYAEADVRGEGMASEERPEGTPPGWDEIGASRSGAVFNGRAGHVRVSVKVRQLDLPRDTVIAIASRVRDRIPEGPMMHPAADRSGRTPPGPNPCSVLARGEAEAELGELVADPYRTRERTPLADPSGKSCAYLTSGHRVLVLTPVWNYGGVELSAARMVGGMVKQVADLPGIEGDTLEGRWDEAVVDLAGELLVRKGGRVLGVRYLMSSADAAGAMRIAELVLGRMAAKRGGEE